MTPMRLIRRLLGLAFGTAGFIGVVLGMAGMAGVWVGYVEVSRRVDHVFDRADQALTNAQDNLHRATARLRETEVELEAVRQREEELASPPAAERPRRREASRKAVAALGPGVADARAMLVKATEAALVANGLLDALAELPAVERVNIDADRLREASARIEELSERSRRLTDLLAKAGPADDREVAGESSRAIEVVRKPIALAKSGSERIEAARRKIADAHARVKGWINTLAAALAVVLVWITAGQLSLLMHGWKIVRKGADP